MRILVFLIALSLTLTLAKPIAAQLVNNGASIIITNSSFVFSEMDVINMNSGIIENEGTLFMENLDNTSNSSLSGNGIFEARGNWTNSALFIPGSSKVILSGGISSFIRSGGDPFYQLELNKTFGSEVSLLDDLHILNNFNFASDNNKLNIGELNLTIGSSGSMSGFDANDFVVTGANGKLIKNDLNPLAFTYPVGFDNLTYNPVSLSNSGAQDHIGVRVLENILDGGDSGLPVGEFGVNTGWELSESIPGGSDLEITAQWSSSDELPGFNRANCEVLKYIGPFWELDGGTFGPASGTDPYTKIKNGVSVLGNFAVGHEFLVVNVKLAADALLDGPSQGSALMNDGLRTSGVIPLTEPYSGLGYPHVGPGGGESIESGVLSVSGNDAIVDWIIVELRSGSDNANIVATRSALLQADGDIVDRDGESDLAFYGISSGDYYISVRHRNHLGAATLNPVTLSRTSTIVDFTNPTTQTFGAFAQKDNNGFMSLWAGDADGDKRLVFAGPGDDPGKIFFDVLTAPGNVSFDPNYIFAGYLNSDLNMDGTSIFAGPGTDANTVFFQVLLHPGNDGFFYYNYVVEEQIPD